MLFLFCILILNNCFMQKNSDHAEMKTMASCLNKLVLDGYTDDFKASDKGLLSLTKEKTYGPADVHVVDFFRFSSALRRIFARAHYILFQVCSITAAF